MSQQINYGTMAKGYAGQRMGDQERHHASTYINDKGSARMVTDVTITDADSTAFAATINGYAIAFTSAASATTATIRDQFIDAVRAIPELEGVVYVSANGANKVRITAAVPGTAFVYSDSDDNLSAAAVTANATTESIPFGRAVVKRTGSGTTDQSAGLPSASTAQVTTLTVAGATNSKTYSFILNVEGFGPTTIEAAGDSDATTAEIATALRARVNALPVPVTASGSGDDVVLTADDAGTPFTLSEVDAQLTQAATTANVLGKFLGVVERIHQDVDAQNPTDSVKPMTAMSVLDAGDVLVEVEHAVAWGDPAYYRTAASGANTKLGAWRKDADSGNAERAPRAEYRSSTTGAGFAVLRLDAA